MKRKGFTLIELLAVILILGIIALIAIPIVNDIINEARKNSFKATVEQIARTVEDKCQLQMLNKEELTTTYTFNAGVVTPALDIKGKLPTSGTISVDNNCNTSFSNITNGKYTATKETASDNILILDGAPKVCKVTQGDGSNIGDVITCGTESFYVYDTTGDTIKMLAKYNLKVGGTYNGSTYTPYTESEMTYMQDENMRGYVSGQSMRYGTSVFSSSEQKGTDYSSYEGSIVEGYVNRYEEILTNMGMNVEEARLIRKAEMEQLVNDGNSLSNGNIKTRADNLNRSWIYETSYWFGSAYAYNRVLRVRNDGYFNYDDYDYYSDIGVRPVIKILKSEI